MKIKKYQSREYCRDIECPKQKMFDGKHGDIINKKHYCKGCGAKAFHEWIQDNGYKIVKPRIGCSLAEIAVDQGEGGNINV